MSTNDPKPFITHDKEYIQKVAESISKKAPLEDIPFHYLTDVLTKLGINETPFDFKDADQFDSELINNLAHRSFNAIPQTLSDDFLSALYRLWDYLAESDDLKPADLIFVFGSANEESPKKAVKLYLEKFASQIMFTGHSAAYQEKMGTSEAERFAKIAEQLGVPRDAMILETQSRNTPENVINGIKLLKERGLKPESIILITYSFHMRRAYLTFRGVLDWNAKLLRQSVASDGRENFFRDEKRWTYVFFEFVKIYAGRMMKHF